MEGTFEVLVRRAALVAGYRLGGRPLLGPLRRLRKSQFSIPEGQRADRLEKLQALVKHAAKCVPYYRSAFGSRGFEPRDLRSLADLQALPILTKATIREHFPCGMLAESVPAREIYRYKTGGSTGTPLEFAREKRGAVMATAAMYRALEWVGHRLGERFLFFWGIGGAPAGALDRLKRAVSDKVLLDAYDLGGPRLEAYAQTIRRAGYRLVYGYPSAMSVLAQHLDAAGCQPGRPMIAVITGEAASDSQIEAIGKVFTAGVFDHYGCREINSIAFECECRTGLHITSEHVIVEVLDEQDRPAPQGAEGELVVTDLDNWAMPFIRYRLGDRASLLGEDCPCKRTLPLMSHVRGRSLDMIRGADGRLVTGIYFIKLLRGGGEGMVAYPALGIQQYQLRQAADGGLRILIVCDRPPDHVALEELRRAFVEKLGPLPFSVEKVPAIPVEASGKRRIIVSEPCSTGA